MTKMLLVGCNGRMGKVITELAAGDPDIVIAAGVDVAGECAGKYPVAASFEEIRAEDLDVIVDFSSPAVFDAMLDYALANKLPVVVCTTGMSEEQIARLNEAAKEIAVLRSANMSLGINLLMKLVREAAQTLAKAGFDIEIVERHHNQKKMRRAEPLWHWLTALTKGWTMPANMYMTAVTVFRREIRKRSASARSAAARSRARMK